MDKASVKTDRQRQEQYSDRIHAMNLIEGWWWEASKFKPRPDQPTEPTSNVKPHIWRWADVGPAVLECGELIGLGQGAKKAERRVLVLSNPGLNGQYAVTNTFFADLQLIKPGEAAPSHRHTTTAARFIFEGHGGWTTVEGERADLEPGDFVINPQWAWHDHGNDGPDDFVFLDVLDIPLMTNLASATWDFDYVKATGDKEKTIQKLVHPKNYSQSVYNTPGMVPKFVQGTRRDHSPLIGYKWRTVKANLQRLRNDPASRYDGVIMEFTNPETGDSVGPTTSVCAQMLRPDERTLAHRENTSTVYICVEGNGVSEIGGTRIEWTKNDIFVVPSWTWHSHANLSKSEDAFLYAASDAPVIRKLGMWREQRMTERNEIEDTGWNAYSLKHL